MTAGFFEGTRRVIICPKRFELDNFFSMLSQRYFDADHSVTWTPEVKIGNFGNIDFVASHSLPRDEEADESDEMEDEDDVDDEPQIVLFELQAGGTTGSPYPAIEDFIENQSFSQTSYSFSINWANEFIKTMGQQIIKKGHAINGWGVPIVFVIQDVAMEYIVDKMNTENLTERPVDAEWPDEEYIHFRTITMGDGDDSMFSLEEGSFYTATLETAEAMLTVEGSIHLNQFLLDLEGRMERAETFTVDT